VSERIRACHDLTRGRWRQAVKDLRRGRDCYIRGQYSEASKHFASAIKHNTSNFTSHLCHALAEIALKQPKNAAADALKLSQLLPAWPKEDVVKEGWLKKESGHGIYKTRWFSLKACFLYYFKKDKVRPCACACACAIGLRLATPELRV